MCNRGFFDKMANASKINTRATRNLRSKSEKSPLAKAKDWLQRDDDPTGFEVSFYPEKGRGIKACRKFLKGEFLMFYPGELITAEEGEKREREKSSGFRFFYVDSGKKMCLDATKETHRLGRLINHAEKKQINCKMKQVFGTLCLFSIRDIQEGEELLYHYGLDDLPWEKKYAGFPLMQPSRVVVINKDGSDGRSFDLQNPYCLLGKSKQCDIVVSCPGTKDIHCVLEHSQNKIYLMDYGVPNPTPRCLEHNDVFQIKYRMFRLEYMKTFEEDEMEVETAVDKEADDTIVIEEKLMEEDEDNIEKSKELIDEDEDNIEKSKVLMDEDEDNIEKSKALMDEDEDNIEKSKALMDEDEDNIEKSKALMDEDEDNIEKIEELMDEDEDNIEKSKALMDEDEDNIEKSKVLMDEDDDYIEKSKALMDEDEDNIEKSKALMDEKEDNIEQSKALMDEKEDNIEKIKELMEDDIECDSEMDKEWFPNLSDVDYSSTFVDSDSEQMSCDAKYEELVPNSDSDDDQEQTVGDRDSYCQGWVSEHYRTESSNHCSDDDSQLSTVIPCVDSEPKGVSLQKTYESENKSSKQHCCLYCNQMYARISRHYLQVHSEEILVAKALALPKKSKERKKQWAELVNKGDFHHNYTVLQKQDGVIIPKYRPRKNQEKKIAKYVPCEFCLGAYLGSDLWKHQKSCGKKENTNHIKGKCIRNGKMLLPTPAGVRRGFYENIITKMRDDAVKEEVKKDPLILSFGSNLYGAKGKQQHKHQYIRQRLRQLGRLVIQMRESNPHEKMSLEKTILPSNWKKLIVAVKEVTGYDEENFSYQTPTLILKLGQSLSRCGELLKAEAIVNRDEVGKRDADDFITLYKSEWTLQVASQACTTLREAKFNKPMYLPIAKDVKLLNSYLERKGEKLKKKIQTDIKYYDTLAEVCLAQLILFNRKRSGETERMEYEQYKNAIYQNGIPSNTDVLDSLSKFEMELCRTHSRIEIRGKTGEKVPVLFTQKMKENVEALVEARKQKNIESKYMFIKSNSEYPIRGSICMKKFAERCGAKAPHLLTSTRLRKHLATMSQILGLSEGDQDVLAKFMGHDIRVHRKYYRLPENVLEVAKVSKVLHLINSGAISEYRGKDFDAIQFNPNELLMVDGEENDDEEDVSFASTAASTSTSAAATLSAATASTSVAATASTSVAATAATRIAAKKVKKKTVPIKRAWSVEEQAAVMRHLGAFFKQGQLPGKRSCELAKQSEPVLNSRTWQQIKHFIRNKLTSARKVHFTV